MIYTVTLNPAVDRILFLNDLSAGRTNRLERREDTIGGKGTHVSINLKLLEVDSVALGFTFGSNGRRINDMMAAEGIETRFLHSNQAGFESRTNYVLIESFSHRSTMITERGPLLSQKITGRLVHQISSLLRNGDILILTGDAGNVEDRSIYTHLANLAILTGARVFLDASGPYLSEGLSACPYLIKPNLEELNSLTGQELSTESDILAAIRTLDRYRIEIIAVTRSGKGALVKWADRFFRVHPVQVQAVNDTGCGDAFLAAMTAGIVKHQSVEDTLRSAAAVAAAAAELDTTSGFIPSRAEYLKSQVKVEEIEI